MSKARVETWKKDDLVAVLQTRMERIFGISLSKEKVFMAFKDSINTAFQMSSTKKVSIPGVGTFSQYSSKRSEKLNRFAKRVKFKPSARFATQLAAGEDFWEKLPEPKEVAKPTVKEPVSPVVVVPLSAVDAAKAEAVLEKNMAEAVPIEAPPVVEPVKKVEVAPSLDL